MFGIFSSFSFVDTKVNKILCSLENIYDIFCALIVVHVHRGLIEIGLEILDMTCLHIGMTL